MKGNLQLTKEQIEGLKKYKKPLRKIFDAIRKKKSIKKRRKLLINQSGGAIGAIASLILGTLASTLANYALDKTIGNKNAN